MKKEMIRFVIGCAIGAAIAIVIGEVCFAESDVRTFGAAGNGVSDDTNAIQKAFDAGGSVHFPSGSYRITHTLSIRQAMQVTGDGESTTQILQQCSNGIWISTPGAVQIERMFFNVQVSGGAAITVQPPGGVVNSQSVFNRLTFFQPWIGIDFVQAELWHMQECNILGPIHYGVRVRNLVNPDDGDWEVSGCTFAGASRDVTFIEYESSGGGRIVNNKFNGGNVSIRLDLAPGANTGDLLVFNNSIENQAICGVYAATEPGASFLNLMINSNEFEQGFMPIFIAGKFKAVTVCNNTVTTFVPAAAGICVIGCDGLAITGNAVTTLAGVPAIAQGGNTRVATGVNSPL